MRTPDEVLAEQTKRMRSLNEEAVLLQARNSFPHFCEYVSQDDKGDRWTFAAHQYEWDRLLNDPTIDLLEIVAPRGHAKSTTLQYWLGFLIGQDTNTCIKYVCGNDSKAVDRLGLIEKLIKENLRYHRVFPHVRPAEGSEWSKHKIFVQRSSQGLQDATVESASVGAGGTGGRCHKLILDDVIDATDAISQPAIIPKTKQFVEADWMSTLFPGGRVVLIGTFWSFAPPDLYVEYRDKPEWRTWCEPACYLSDNNELVGPFLWPERFGKEELDARRRRVDEETFRQQYLLQGMVQRNQYFSPQHISACKSYTTFLGETPFDIAKIGIGLDPATSRGKSGSYGCVFVSALGTCGKKLPLNIIRLKADPEVLTRAVVDQYCFWEDRLGVPISILVENNATQESFSTLIRLIGETQGKRNLPIRGKHTGSQKWQPDGGLPTLNAEMAQQKWIIPMGGDHGEAFHRCPVCQWLNEMQHWGKNQDDKGQKVTTDLIMAWWLSSVALDKASGFGDIPMIVTSDQREINYGFARSMGSLVA